jgi:hypothetical protein
VSGGEAPSAKDKKFSTVQWHHYYLVSAAFR